MVADSLWGSWAMARRCSFWYHLAPLSRRRIAALLVGVVVAAVVVRVARVPRRPQLPTAFHRWNDRWIYEVPAADRARADTDVRAFLATAPAGTRVDVVEVFASETKMDSLRRGLHTGRYEKADAVRWVPAGDAAGAGGKPSDEFDDALLAARGFDPLGSAWLAVEVPNGHGGPAQRARLSALLAGATDDALVRLFGARGILLYTEGIEDPADSPTTISVSTEGLLAMPADVRPALRARLERSSGRTLALVRDEVRKIAE